MAQCQHCQNYQVGNKVVLCRLKRNTIIDGSKTAWNQAPCDQFSLGNNSSILLMIISKVSLFAWLALCIDQTYIMRGWQSSELESCVDKDCRAPMTCCRWERCHPALCRRYHSQLGPGNHMYSTAVWMAHCSQQPTDSWPGNHWWELRLTVERLDINVATLCQASLRPKQVGKARNSDAAWRIVNWTDFS